MPHFSIAMLAGLIVAGGSDAFFELLDPTFEPALESLGAVVLALRTLRLVFTGFHGKPPFREWSDGGESTIAVGAQTERRGAAGE
jgi:hypothetical protein